MNSVPPPTPVLKSLCPSLHLFYIRLEIRYYNFHERFGEQQLKYSSNYIDIKSLLYLFINKRRR